MRPCSPPRPRSRAAPRRGPALAALLAALACACSTLPELDWNPLLRVEHAADGSVEVEALGPLVDLRVGDDGVSHALRPLYQRRANAGRPITDFLAPFGRVWDVHDGTRYRFWPLVWNGETHHESAGDRWGLIVFPLILAGNGPRDDDGYFAFWPLGGRTREIFGIHCFDFALWPLFMRTRMEVTEPSTSWTVLLLGGWTTGGPRDGSFRVLPFYRRRLVDHADGRPRTDQRTVAWPFFTWGDDHLDSRDPSWRWAFWPLAAHERAARWSRTTWLWPFFRANRESDPPPAEGGQFRYDLPWPFFHWSAGDDERRFRIWPLYASFESPELDSTAFVIPLGWWREDRGRTSEMGWPSRPYQRRDLWLLPFWHGSTREVQGRQGQDTQRHLWPLFHADAQVAGTSHAAFPSVVLARHWEFLRPVDDLFGPFFTLWRHRERGDARETRLLLDTTFWRRSAEGLRVSIPFLYSQRPLAAAEGASGRRHGLLWGLLGASTDDEGLLAFSLAGWDLWHR